MNKFNEARAKNIEDLKKVVKDIEDGKIKFFQMVAFHTDDEGFAKGLQVIGTMSPYAARGVNESLAEKAREQIQSIPDTNSNGISLSDLLGMFGESGKEYKDWFNEPLVGPTRKIAACLAFLYYMDPEDQAKEKEEATQNKEQVKRQKACPFCRDDSVEKEWNLIETPDEGIPVTWINGNVLETENYGSTLGCPINFCPMCGRKLEAKGEDDDKD